MANWRPRSQLKRAIIAIVLAGVFGLALPLAAQAVITQSFCATEPMVGGMIVSFSASKPGCVEPATQSNLASLYGVVYHASSSKVDVATSEVIPVLVSTANGDIVTGSPITASSLKGIGQKATQQTRIVGFAQAPLNKKAAGVVTETIKDKSGKDHRVTIGAIPVLFGVANYTPSAGAEPSGNSQASFLPQGLQRFFDTIAGKQVVPSKAMLALFLLLVVIVIIGAIVGTSVHSTLVSLGRNPLASRSLFKGLIQVGAIVVALIVGAMGGVFVIITH